MVREAAKSIAQVSAYGDAAIIRSVADLESALSWPLPWTNSKDDVDVLRVQNGLVLSLIRKPRNTAGSPTQEVERATGGVATTRNRESIDRLLKAAASWR